MKLTGFYEILKREENMILIEGFEDEILFDLDDSVQLDLM